MVNIFIDNLQKHKRGLTTYSIKNEPIAGPGLPTGNKEMNNINMFPRSENS